MSPTETAHRILASLEASWNRADGAAYGAHFAEDAEFVDIRGELHRGRGAIAGGHQWIFDNIYKGSRMTYRLVGARAVTDDVIVAHGLAFMETTNHMFDGRHAINTFVVVRNGENWLIAAFHNALADAGTPAPDTSART
jgi:uncharacterized protein (TIGR02246 family)